MVVFSQKADDNVAKIIKALDEVSKGNDKLGTVMVGVSGVEAADLEKLHETHKFTCPLTIAKDKDGPKAWALNKEAAVTVVVYPRKGTADVFAFKDTASAAAKASDIAESAKKKLSGK